MSTRPYQNQVTAPAANTVILQSDPLPAGDYKVSVLAGYVGTGDAPDNMQLVLPVGSSPKGPVTLWVSPSPLVSPTEQVIQVTCPQGGVLQIVNPLAGALGAVYNAQMLVTPRGLQP